MCFENLKMFSVNLKIASLGQRRFYSTTAKPLLGKFNETPLVLYRIQSGAKASLRDYETQKAKGRTSFDLVLKDNLVIPYKGENFVRMISLSSKLTCRPKRNVSSAWWTCARRNYS